VHLAPPITGTSLPRGYIQTGGSFFSQLFNTSFPTGIMTDISVEEQLTFTEDAPSADVPPASQAPPRIRPGLGIGRTVWLCVIFYIMFFGTMLLMQLLFSLLSPSGSLPIDPVITLLIPQLVAWLVTIKRGLQFHRSTLAAVCPLTPFSPRLLPPLLVASFGATILLGELASWIPMSQEFSEAVAKTLFDSNPFAVFALAVVIAPIAEEIFFRGLVLHGYLARYSVTKAVWVSSILFGLFHLNPWQAVVAIPLGIWFAWLVLRTGSVLPGIVGHAAVNFSTTFLLRPIGALMGYSAEDIAEADHFPMPIIALGAIAAIIGGYFHWRQIVSLSPPPALPNETPTYESTPPLEDAALPVEPKLN
jgi:uncharacterized protein